MTPTITPRDHDAYMQVLWYFDPTAPGARQPGSFSHHLIQAFARADITNTLLLSSVYPAYGTAMRMVQEGLNGGLDQLKTWGQQITDGSLGPDHD